MTVRRWADRLDAAALAAIRSPSGRRIVTVVEVVAAVASVLLGLAIGLPSLVYAYFPGLVGAGLALVLGAVVGATAIAGVRKQGAA